MPLPAGAIYLFFRVRGLDDSLAFCKALVAEAGVGLAPGSAFGDAGEGCLRWCIASSIEKLEQGADRFSRFLHRSPLRRCGADPLVWLPASAV